MFLDTADVEVEITVEGEIEPVAQGVGDGMGGTDEGLIVLVGEVLEVLNGLVELTGLETGLNRVCDKVARGLGTGDGRDELAPAPWRPGRGKPASWSQPSGG